MHSLSLTNVSNTLALYLSLSLVLSHTPHTGQAQRERKVADSNLRCQHVLGRQVLLVRRVVRVSPRSLRGSGLQSL